MRLMAAPMGARTPGSQGVWIPDPPPTACPQQLPKNQNSLEEVSTFIQTLLLPFCSRLGQAPLERLWYVPVNASLQTMHTPWNTVPKESARKR